ncbi:ATP-binding protein [Actinobacillus equuli subsp. haemolyticus]|uniref:ATP-binding protein n=1 Tax=Actinobacillus equuli TaxID=718 RepID=UPI0024420C07|nr:ATP-binding protein [Actinobacillus equuli]WGE67025.1 ATP-binding protein [Actinobacillus equuli subsp. haemolyticus]
MTSTNDILEMKFDPNVITHLGIQMYSTLPPVVAELVSNSYDAEAEDVNIFLNDKSDEKSIIIEDNGHGMSFEEINQKFLVIGRNRRKEEKSEKSKNGKRDVIGKKGIGKLAFFGIANEITISTIQNYKQTTFLLDWEEMQNQESEKGTYHPKILDHKKSVDKESGTIIKLMKIKRKSKFDAKDLAHSLSAYFQVFNEEDFNVFIYHNDDNKKSPFPVTNDLRYEGIDTLVTWESPWNELKLNSDEEKTCENYLEKITGKLIAGGRETIPEKMRGVALFSRGKLVNKYSFYGLSATSFGYSYITGWLNVDFIEDFPGDVISTDRGSLNWELDETKRLEEVLQIMIKKLYNFQKSKREQDKQEKIERDLGINFEEWYATLPKHERVLAKKIMKQIVNAEGLEPDKARSLVQFVQDSYQFESFKELAHDIANDDFQEPEKLVALMKEWQLIEAREFYKLAKVRLETINKFENYIQNNAKEVPTLHNFLTQFPWLLDPRIMSFKDEVTYSKLLKENFKEEELEEKDRRIDFLCQNFAGKFFIIELKRPNTVVNLKELLQGISYVSFIKEKLGNEIDHNIHCYIIAGSLSKKNDVKIMADAHKMQGTLYVRTYTELLQAAKSYHNEFIEKYENMKKI